MPSPLAQRVQPAFWATLSRDVAGIWPDLAPLAVSVERIEGRDGRGVIGPGMMESYRTERQPTAAGGRVSRATRRTPSVDTRPLPPLRSVERIAYRRAFLRPKHFARSLGHPGENNQRATPLSGDLMHCCRARTYVNNWRSWVRAEVA